MENRIEKERIFYKKFCIIISIAVIAFSMFLLFKTSEVNYLEIPNESTDYSGFDLLETVLVVLINVMLYFVRIGIYFLFYLIAYILTLKTSKNFFKEYLKEYFDREKLLEEIKNLTVKIRNIGFIILLVFIFINNIRLFTIDEYTFDIYNIIYSLICSLVYLPIPNIIYNQYKKRVIFIEDKNQKEDYNEKILSNDQIKKETKTYNICFASILIIAISLISASIITYILENQEIIINIGTADSESFIGFIGIFAIFVIFYILGNIVFPYVVIFILAQMTFKIFIKDYINRKDLAKKFFKELPKIKYIMFSILTLIFIITMLINKLPFSFTVIIIAGIAIVAYLPIVNIIYGRYLARVKKLNKLKNKD